MTAEQGNAEAEALERGARIIRAGGLVIVATETFYGIAADPFNTGAVERIYRVKGRIASKPLALIASDKKALARLSPVMTPALNALADRFWPGSLTIVLEIGVAPPPLLMGPGGKLGVRIPPPCPARELAQRAGGVITATSANLSGGPDPDRIEKISPDLLASVDLAIDTGPSPGGNPSTLVETCGGDCRIIREGAIPESMILEVLHGCCPRKSS
jgi:L-threonylcarbamoyladenylate synthase